MTPPTPPLSFGALLKRHRRLARLTQEQLAERAGFSPSHISMLERAERTPVVATTELLADALGLSGADRDAFLAAQRRALDMQVEQDAAEHAYAIQRHTPSARLPMHDARPLAADGYPRTALETPLVAREPEMRQLLSILAALLAAPPVGAGRLVMLSGEPGIGKTRLTQELALHARARGMLVATGHCDERHQSIGFAPVGEALSLLHAAAPARLRAEAADRWPETLALLPDGPLPLSAASIGDAPEIRQTERVLHQVAGFVAAVAASQPVLLILDDLHWADGASLDALRQLARHTRAPRVLLLGTYREQEVRRQPLLREALLDLVHDRLVERIALRPLAPAETAALMTATLGAGTIDDSLLDAVQATTQGNPFFIQEIVRALLERGEIALVDDRWRHASARPGELALPESVRQTLTERAARLSPLARDVLRDASVLGLAFALEPLARMGGHPLDAVEAALEEALTAELIREADGLKYAFTHALTQRAIYSEIPAPRLRHLHRAAGEALEGLRPVERARRAAELAQHFLRGDAPERALPYAIQAGDQATRLYAQAEAQQHYSLAIDLATELGDQYSGALARERRADVLYVRGHPDAAYADLAAATHRYRVLRDWERLTWATCLLAKVCDAYDRVSESMRFMEELLASLVDEARRRDQQSDAQAHEPPATLAERAELASTILSVKAAARLFLCFTARFVHLGRLQEAVAFNVPTIAHARQADEPRFESLAYSFCATAQQSLGQLDEAIHSLEEARRAAEAAGDPEARFMALVSLAAIHQVRAEPHAAQRNALQALQALTLLDDIPRRSALLLDLGWAAFVLGDWGEARARWEQALAVGGQADNSISRLAELNLLLLDITEGKRPLAAIQATDSLLDASQGDPLELRVEALRCQTETRILAGRATGQRDPLRALRARAKSAPIDPSEFSMLLGWVELDQGDDAAAARELAQARQEADARHNRALYADLWRIEALLALRQRRWANAARALDHALALCRAMPHPYAEAKALSVYGQLHAARGEPEPARACYQAALAILARLGEHLYAERVESALAALAPIDARG